MPRRLLADERGLTLIELLVGMVTGVIVAGAAMAFLIISIDQQNAASSRSAAVNQAQAGLQQLTRDLRDAEYQNATQTTSYAVTVTTSASANTISFRFDIPDTTSSDAAVPVAWTCPGGPGSTLSSCTRSLNGGSAKPMIAGVQSAAFVLMPSSGSTITPSTAATSTTTYPSASTASLASVQITLTLQQLSQLDATQTHMVTGSRTVTLQTSADLRNFA